jgi:hypothetical protein
MSVETSTGSGTRWLSARARAGSWGSGLVLAPGDLARLSAEGRAVALLAVEGGDPLEGDARYVRELHRIGAHGLHVYFITGACPHRRFA